MKTCPICGTTSKKKLSVEIIGNDFKASCVCGYVHKLSKSQKGRTYES